MTSAQPGAPAGSRPKLTRNAAATRQSLLEAAGALFGEHGFDRTTVRMIAEKAGVDPTLIVRYFGNKADMYLAAVDAGFDHGQITDEIAAVRDLALRMISTGDSTGIHPAMRAMLQLPVDDEARATAMVRYERGVLEPLTALLEREGNPSPRLTAEIIASALIGVVMMRCAGTFGALAEADRAEVARILGGMENLGADIDTDGPASSIDRGPGDVSSCEDIT